MSASRRDLIRSAIVVLTVALATALQVGPLVAQEPAGPDSPAAAAAAFHQALAGGYRDQVLALLAPGVVIFEAGGAEMSQDEYAAHHLGADMEFATSTRREILDQRSGGSGDIAWILTRSETAGSFRGREVRSRGTETMVLEHHQGAWRIVHIHWSSGESDG